MRMELVKHETCLEYFQRRLREGWRCILLKGYNAVLLSPDGIRRKLDLRDDIETLRPSGVGTNTEFQGVIGAATHWGAVDDVIPDEGTTRIYNCTTGYQVDTFELPDSGVGAGTINSVKVYFRFWSYTASTVAYAKAAVYTNSVTHYGDEESEADDWTTYDFTWVNNPETTNPWTWAEINALEAGVAGKGITSYCCNVTQVYVEVDYTPAPPGWSGKIAGVTDPAAIMGVVVADIEKVKGVASA